MGFTGCKPLHSPEQAPHFDIISLVVPVIIYKLYQHFFVYFLRRLPPTLLCQYFMIKSCPQGTHILVLFEWPEKWSSFRGNPYSGESACTDYQKGQHHGQLQCPPIIPLKLCGYLCYASPSVVESQVTTFGKGRML